MLLRSLIFATSFWCSALAEAAGVLHDRSDILPRQQQCRTAGWIPVCPGVAPCMPPSGTCCTGGYYHLPGETCPRGQSEVPRIGQTAPPSASITPAPTPLPIPAPAPPVIDYTWYTYTVTYYYYYYYYYYFAATYQLTSTRTTYFTTVSLTASNQVAANSAFASLSATIALATPTQAATPTLGSVPLPTSTPVIPVIAPSSLSATTATSSKAAVPTANSTLPSAPPPPVFTGAASGLRSGYLAGLGSVIAVTVGGLCLAPGMLMFVL